jgi:hypothetical protein
VDGWLGAFSSFRFFSIFIHILDFLFLDRWIASFALWTRERSVRTAFFLLCSFLACVEIRVWRDCFHELGAHFELSLDAFMRIGIACVRFWVTQM